MKCLVVDPSPTMTRVIRNILRGAGADEFLCASGADAAIELMEKQKSPELDLVVTERDLSGRNGLELLAALRSREGLAELPAIVVSARNSRRDVLEALHSGADAYVLKPLDQESLLSRAVAVLQARNDAGEATDEATGGDESPAVPEDPPSVEPAAGTGTADDPGDAPKDDAPAAGTGVTGEGETHAGEAETQAGEAETHAGEALPEDPPEDEDRRAA